MIVADQLVAVPRVDLEQLIVRSAQRWLNVNEAAEYARVSDKSIRRAVARGELTPSKAVKGKQVFDRRQLDSWLMAGMK